MTNIIQLSPGAESKNADLFLGLGLIEPLVRALQKEGYERPTDIQQRTIPELLKGRDLIGCAQTGTGKTAAFVLPILQLLHGTKPIHGKRDPRALILTPTRELAVQIDRSISAYGRYLPIRHTVIYGGVNQCPQVTQLRRGVDIVVATPGRMRDLINQREINLDRIEFVVLDEADRMLDQGFLPDVSAILACTPRRKQSLLFSATMPNEIVRLAQRELDDPVTVSLTPISSAPDTVQQSVYFVSQADKRKLLDVMLEDKNLTRVIVFTRTKHGADRVARQLISHDEKADAIHGNKSQKARELALAKFRDGKLRVLVATDVAARGIDVDDISHVINYDLPQDAEGYVHRIGRTARAGASGIAMSFCSAEEFLKFHEIEKLTKIEVPRVVNHPFRLDGNTIAALFPSARAGRIQPTTRVRHFRPRRPRMFG